MYNTPHAPTADTTPKSKDPRELRNFSADSRNVEIARTAYSDAENHVNSEMKKKLHSMGVLPYSQAKRTGNDDAYDQDLYTSLPSAPGKAGYGHTYNPVNGQGLPQQQRIDGQGCHSEKHKMTSSEYLKALVFGGLDGIVTVFAIVAGSVGAKLNPMQIIIIGIGNLLADAVSMAFGEYVSAKAEQDFIRSERSREEWEVDNCPEEEKNEMLEIYMERYGFTDEDARTMVDVTFKYPTFFIQHMMVEELGLMAADDGATPSRRGMVMFLSFSLFGLVPLGGFIGWEAAISHSVGNDSTSSAFLIACLVSLATLFVLGFFKGRFVGQNALTSGALMTINGGLAGSVAFLIGDTLQRYVGGTGLPG